MIDIGLVQFAGIWTELTEALYDRNHYGGTEAEIYAYRLLPHDPIAASHKNCEPGSMFYNDMVARAKLAGDTLAQILLLFKEKYKCKITVEGKPFRKKVPPFDHRLHVGVIDAR
jgi:hypothetical protein